MQAVKELKEVRIMKVEDEHSHLPKKTLHSAEKRLSSVLENRRPLRGVSGEVERKLLPKVINVSADADDFDEKAADYWKNLTVKVDGDGYQLSFENVDTDNVEDLPTTHIEDYLIYHWAQRHPLVADTKEEAMAQPTRKWFYIYDPEEEDRKDASSAQDRIEAYSELRKLVEKPELINHVIRILTDNRPERLTDEKKLSILDRQAETNAKEFLRVVKDDNVEVRSEILEMIEKEVLRKVGNQIMFIDETIGNTMEEAVAYFNNKKNSSTVSTMRAKLKEARRS